MIKAVIFDMYETLITHYQSPLYFGKQMAADAGIQESEFRELWDNLWGWGECIQFLRDNL